MYKLIVFYVDLMIVKDKKKEISALYLKNNIGKMHFTNQRKLRRREI